MKKFVFRAMAAISLMIITGCGSPYSNSVKEQEPATNLTTSIEAIGSMLDFAQMFIDECSSVSSGVLKCRCPGGGTVTITDTADSSGSFVFDGCIDQINQYFNGEMTFTGDQVTTFNFDRAAYCNDLVSTEAGADCSGSIRAECMGLTYGCTFQKDSKGNCVCL